MEEGCREQPLTQCEDGVINGWEKVATERSKGSKSILRV